MSRKESPPDRGAFRATLRHYHAPQREKRRRGNKQDEIFRQKLIMVLRVALVSLAVGVLIMIVVALIVDRAV